MGKARENSNQKPFFVQLDEWAIDILLSNELTKTTRRLFWFLVKFDRFGNRFVDIPSQSEIAEALGARRETINQAQAQLQRLGLWDFKVKTWQGRNLAAPRSQEYCDRHLKVVSTSSNELLEKSNNELEKSNNELEKSNNELEKSNNELEKSNKHSSEPLSVNGSTTLHIFSEKDHTLSEPATPPTPPQPTAESEKSASLQKQPSEENQKSSPPKPVVKNTSTSESKLAVEENQHSRRSTFEASNTTNSTFEVNQTTEIKAAKIFAAEIGHEELKKFSDEQFIAWQKHCQELAKELSFEIVFLSKTVKANFSAFWNPWVEKIKHQQEQMEFRKNARVETDEERQAYNARRKTEIEEYAKRGSLKQRIRQQQQN